MELARCLRRNEFKQSLEYLERAKTLRAEKCRNVYKLEGWTYYGLNRPDGGGRVEKIRWLCGTIRKCRRRGTRRLGQSRRKKITGRRECAFQRIQRHGGAVGSREFCMHWKGITSRFESELNYSPPDPIGVVL